MFHLYQTVVCIGGSLSAEFVERLKFYIGAEFLLSHCLHRTVALNMHGKKHMPHLLSPS